MCSRLRASRSLLPRTHAHTQTRTRASAHVHTRIRPHQRAHAHACTRTSVYTRCGYEEQTGSQECRSAATCTETGKKHGDEAWRVRVWRTCPYLRSSSARALSCSCGKQGQFKLLGDGLTRVCAARTIAGQPERAWARDKRARAREHCSHHVIARPHPSLPQLQAVPRQRPASAAARHGQRPPASGRSCTHSRRSARCGRARASAVQALGLGR